MNLDIYNNIIINKSLVRLIGAENTVYWSELMFILQRVYDKKTYNEDGYFKVNRSYIQNELGLTYAQQYNCDSVLNQLGVLDYDSEDRDVIRISPSNMNQIIISENPENSETIKNLTQLKTETKKFNKDLALRAEKLEKAKVKAQEQELKAEAKVKKTQAIVGSFQKILETKFNIPNELKTLYFDWVDSVYARGLFLTNAVISLFISDLNIYTTDLKIQAELLKIAVKTGYRDFSYVKNYFEKANLTVNPGLSPQNQVSIPQPKANLNSTNKSTF